METKTKKNPCFAQTPYSFTKLCNIFDEAFLFDVSIVVLVTSKNEEDPIKNEGAREITSL